MICLSRCISDRPCPPSPPSAPALPVQISVLPRCSGVGEVLEAQTLAGAGAAFARCAAATVLAILCESYLSLGALLFLFAVLFGLCRGGGIGAIPSECGVSVGVVS